jgi:uncharacterized protein (TIGR03086 family)
MVPATIVAAVDVIDLDRRAGERMARLIADIPPGAWTAPTPCAHWTVRDLVAHVVGANVKYTGIAAGDDFAPGVPDIDLGENAAATYRRTLAEMVDAWRRPGALDREIGLPRGQSGPAEMAAWIHLAETLAHGWDLARATGQHPDFDEEVIRACLEDCKRRMPPQRGEGSPFADATLAEGHSLIDQLAAYLGRDVAAESP